MNFLVVSTFIALIVSATCVPLLVPTVPDEKSLGRELKISDDGKSGDLEEAASAYVVYPHYPIHPYYHYAYHYPYVVYGK